MRKVLIAATALMLAWSGSVPAGETKAPENAKVYFINLRDGDTVSSPFKVQFGLSGMGVAPAGTEKAKTGHHHLLVNRPAFGKGPDGTAEFDANLPADDNHIHFGGGQTETTLNLAPGRHTLQLVFADMNHIPHDKPVVSPVITITVK